MKLKQLFLTMVAVLAFAASSFAQTTTTSTTLSSAITSTSATTISVASATGFTAGTTSLFVDRELMDVISVSGTTIGVRRGSGGITSTHASGATVYVGPRAGGPFIASEKAGSCTSTNELYLPQINPTSGNRYDCDSSAWRYVGGPATVTTTFDGLTLGAAGTVILEGTTADAFEVTISGGDPTTPDKTFTLPDASGTAMVSTLSTNSITAANSVWGASNAVVFEGATADGVETTISVTDPTSSDITFTLPDTAGTAASIMVSTLTTAANAPEAANAVWGASNGLKMEGATADTSETTISPTDPTGDRTVTVPDSTFTLGTHTVSFVQGGTAADALDTIFFIADRGYIVTAIKAVWGTAESTGSMDIMVEKLDGTDACASGDDLLQAVVDATGTANTVATGTLVASSATLTLAAGDRLCVDLSATPNEVVNMVVTVGLRVAN